MLCPSISMCQQGWMPWLGVRGTGDFGEQPAAALSGSFSAKGAVPGWGAHGSLLVLVDALISCSTVISQIFRCQVKGKAFGFTSATDL